MSEAPPLILHVIHHLVIGGLENGLVNLINRMPASAYRHAVACIEDYSEFRYRIARPDVEVVALHRSRIGFRKLQAEIFRLCRRLRPAIIHSRGMSGLDALLPARLAGVRYCVHGEHGWDVDNLHGRKWKPALLRRLHAPLVTHYIAVSRDLEGFMIRRVGVSPRRITQIYNGVDTDRFSPAGSNARELLPAQMRADDSIVVGTVGRIQAVKDQATLLAAVARLNADRPELGRRMRVMIVGDGPLLPALRHRAAELEIAAQTWFAGSMSNVPDALRAMDVFVLPSLNEGISNTILEAMATGLPILATRVGGNVELLEDGVTGRFFAPRDVDALARLLQDFAANPALRDAHGRAARRIAVERFSLDAMIANYKAVYDGLCGPGGTEPTPRAA